MATSRRAKDRGPRSLPLADRLAREETPLRRKRRDAVDADTPASEDILNARTNGKETTGDATPRGLHSILKDSARIARAAKAEPTTPKRSPSTRASPMKATKRVLAKDALGRWAAIRRDGLKTPLCAFSLWYGERRKQFRRASDASKVLSTSPAVRAAWASLPERERASYKARAKRLRVQYAKVLKACGFHQQSPESMAPLVEAKAAYREYRKHYDGELCKPMRRGKRKAGKIKIDAQSSLFGFGIRRVSKRGTLLGFGFAKRSKDEQSLGMEGDPSCVAGLPASGLTTN